MEEMILEKGREVNEIEEDVNKMLHTPRNHNIIPIEREYEIKLTRKLDEINEILAPTVSKLSKLEVVDELREKLFVGLKPEIDKFNKCTYSSKDIHDNRKCCENLLNSLNTSGMQLAMNLAKEY